MAWMPGEDRQRLDVGDEWDSGWTHESSVCRRMHGGLWMTIDVGGLGSGNAGGGGRRRVSFEIGMEGLYWGRSIKMVYPFRLLLVFCFSSMLFFFFLEFSMRFFFLELSMRFVFFSPFTHVFFFSFFSRCLRFFLIYLFVFFRRFFFMHLLCVLI